MDENLEVTTTEEARTDQKYSSFSWLCQINPFTNSGILQSFSIMWLT
jgi:hypothetical protein